MTFTYVWQTIYLSWKLLVSWKANEACFWNET